MDTITMEVLAKAGTVAILIYLLIQVLAAYGRQSNRIVDMLENEINRDDDRPKFEQGVIPVAPSTLPLMDIPKPPQIAENGRLNAK